MHKVCLKKDHVGRISAKVKPFSSSVKFQDRKFVTKNGYFYNCFFHNSKNNSSSFVN